MEEIQRAPHPGLLGRSAYTYLHLPIVAGVVLFAAGNELALIHPGERADLQTSIGIIAGAMLYLVGLGLFNTRCGAAGRLRTWWAWGCWPRWVSSRAASRRWAWPPRARWCW